MIVDVLFLPNGQVGREIDIYLACFLGILRCNDNDTVRSSCTIDSSSSCVFQYVDALNVVGVDIRNLGLNGYSVNYNQWRCLRIERTGTTDLHLTAIGGKTSNTTFQVTDDIRGITTVQFICADRCYRTRHLRLGDILITRHNHLVDHYVRLHNYLASNFVHSTGDGDVGSLHAHIRVFQGS